MVTINNYTVYKVTAWDEDGNLLLPQTTRYHALW
jgi:hypothetical protein